MVLKRRTQCSYERIGWQMKNMSGNEVRCKDIEMMVHRHSNMFSITFFKIANRILISEHLNHFSVYLYCPLMCLHHEILSQDRHFLSLEFSTVNKELNNSLLFKCDEWEGLCVRVHVGSLGRCVSSLKNLFFMLVNWWLEWCEGGCGGGGSLSLPRSSSSAALRSLAAAALTSRIASLIEAGWRMRRQRPAPCRYGHMDSTWSRSTFHLTVIF